MVWGLYEGQAGPKITLLPWAWRYLSYGGMLKLSLAH